MHLQKCVAPICNNICTTTRWWNKSKNSCTQQHTFWGFFIFLFCQLNALQRTSMTPTAHKVQSKRRSALNPFTSWQTMTHYPTNINGECAVCKQWSPVWIKNICPCFMALERIIRAGQQSPNSNLYSSSPEEKHTGVTTALVINRRRHLCVYLSFCVCTAVLYLLHGSPAIIPAGHQRRLLWTKAVIQI